MDLEDKFFRDFLMLWATIDPIGTLSIFVAVTASIPVAMHRTIAIRASLISAAILLAFIIIGQLLLSALEISMAAFEISGGIVLFLFGLQMVFGSVGHSEHTETEKGHDVAVFPLAVPSIASPGAIMAVTMLTDNQQYPVTVQLGTTCIMLLVVALTCLLMLNAYRVHRWLGEAGGSILIRVMGLLLAALATESVIEGLQSVFGTTA